MTNYFQVFLIGKRLLLVNRLCVIMCPSILPAGYYNNPFCHRDTVVPVEPQTTSRILQGPRIHKQGGGLSHHILKHTSFNQGMGEQVVALKGLDISRPTTVVMPNHIGFAQVFSRGTDSVAKALWDSNRQGSIFTRKLKTSKQHPFDMDISHIYLYFMFLENLAKSFKSRGFLKKNEPSINTISPGEGQIN